MGEVERPRDPLEPLAVCRELGCRLRHGSERAHVGDGQVGRRGDRLDAGALEGADRRGAGVELLDLLLGAHPAASGRRALGGGDDEVALEHRDVDLERADDAADVGAAPGAGEQVLDAPVEAGELVGGGVALGAERARAAPGRGCARRRPGPP